MGSHHGVCGGDVVVYRDIVLLGCFAGCFSEGRGIVCVDVIVCGIPCDSVHFVSGDSQCDECAEIGDESFGFIGHVFTRAW